MLDSSLFCVEIANYQIPVYLRIGVGLTGSASRVVVVHADAGVTGGPDNGPPLLPRWLDLLRVW